MNNKKLNATIEEGDTFFSNEATINFNPIQFFMDFKNIAPRVDVRSKPGELHINIKHNVITFSPHQAKQVLGLLGKAIENYEKEFGTIEKPKAIEKIESKGTTEKQEVKEIPTYFG